MREIRDLLHIAKSIKLFVIVQEFTNTVSVIAKGQWLCGNLMRLLPLRPASPELQRGEQARGRNDDFFVKS